MTWHGLQVTIVGMGRSAAGAAALLQHKGAVPFVTDHASGEALAPWREALERLGVAYEIGGHTNRAWVNADLVVLSPGVPPAIPPVQAMRGRGIPVIGELELAHRFSDAPVLAVTGTNGKTTVTEMIQHVLKAAGKDSILAGNNHTSYSEAVLRNPAPDFFVLEVSSYQLETVDEFRPAAGAVLNVTPDHLGRHGTLENYAATKARLFMNQSPVLHAAVLNADDPVVRPLKTPPEVRRILFSVDAATGAEVYWDGNAARAGGVPYPFTPPLPGRHNLSNAMAALAVLYGAQLDFGACAAALESFRGVEHRLERVGEVAGATFYNDSKSTNVDSLRVALESFEGPLTLIAGGQGKGSSYAPLVPLVAEKVRLLVAIGNEGPALAEAFGRACPVAVVDGMEAAVREAASNTPAGVVLLSPGCASFDQYTNFEARGAHFKALVSALRGKEGES